MAHDREVGGIRCLKVLELLPDYLEDELDSEIKKKLEAHLKGCSWCERFGGSYSGTVADIRRLLRDPEPLDEEVRKRLARRLDDELTCEE